MFVPMNACWTIRKVLWLRNLGQPFILYKIDNGPLLLIDGIISLAACALQVEAYTLREAVLLGKELGLCNVMVEGDRKSLADMVFGKSVCQQPMEVTIQDHFGLCCSLLGYRVCRV